jgi:hypothetical protein
VRGGAVEEIQALKRQAMRDAQTIANLEACADQQSKEVRRLRAVVEKWQPMIEDMEAMRRVLGTTMNRGTEHG